MGAFSIWHWLVVLVIVVVIFGTKKLRNIGGDLGSAIKNFKSAMKEEENKTETPAPSEPPKISAGSGRVIDAEVTKEKKNV